MADLLTRDVLGGRDAVAAVREGLTHDALETVRRALYKDAPNAALSASAAQTLSGALGVSERTLSRRKGGRLSTQESDRLLLIAETFDLAAQALDDEDRARAWLTRPHALLGGEAPLSRLDTSVGAREVQALLHHIECGMVA